MVKGDQVNRTKKIVTKLRQVFREALVASSALVSSLWGGGLKAILVGFVWLSLASNLVFTLVELFIQTSLYLSSEQTLGLTSSLTLYAVGGRIAAVSLFLILATTLGVMFRGFTIWLAAIYASALVFNIDSLILNLLNSADPLQPFVPWNSNISNFLATILPVIFFISFAVVILEIIITSQPFDAYVQSLSPAIRNLKISEIVIWSLLLIFSSTSFVSWVVLFLLNEPPVFWTYPIAGRLMAIILCAVLALLSVLNKGLLITFSVLVVLVELVDVDELLVAVYDQIDRFSEVPSELFTLIELRDLSLQLISLALVWVVIRSIADGVRKRTRARVDEWVDSRRFAIFGAEDEEPASPKRISVIAVLALVVSIPVPLAGLVLAYAARNDFVTANPRKSGMDLAIAATIISWFGIGVQGLALALVVLAGVLDIEVFELIGSLLSQLTST